MLFYFILSFSPRLNLVCCPLNTSELIVPTDIRILHYGRTDGLLSDADVLPSTQ